MNCKECVAYPVCVAGTIPDSDNCKRVQERLKEWMSAIESKPTTIRVWEKFWEGTTWSGV